MSQVKDLTTNEVIDIDDAGLPNAVLTGSVAIPDGEYDFENALGERVKVPASQFREAVDAGYKYIDEGIKKEERLQAEYGDSPTRAIAEGAIRSLTLGVSDQLLPKIGFDAEGLRERKERNPISSAIGEGVGIIAPIIATGGAAGAARGIGAKILEKSAAGQVAKLAATAGKGAGSLVKNEIAKGAVKLGVDGAVEGALLGVGKTISEDGLGDTEFSAESLMANVGTGALFGAGGGAALGATGAVISKLGKTGYQKAQVKAIDQLDIPASEKVMLKERLKQGKELESLVEQFENPELKQAIQDLGYRSEPTISVLSPIESTKRLGTSISDNLSIPGIIEKKKLDAFVEETQKKAGEFFDVAKDTTPYQAGLEAKKQLFAGVNEKLRPSNEAFDTIYKNLGEAPVKDRRLKLLTSRINKDDLVALKMDKGLAQRIDDAIPALTTINRVKKFRQAIGKEMGFALRNGDTNQAGLLSDIYHTLRRTEKAAIGDAAAKTTTKKNSEKVAKLAIDTYEKAMQEHASIFKEFSPVAEQLGVKIKRPDDFLDWLEATEPEKIGARLIDINDYDSAVKLRDNFPELFDIARGRKLADIMKATQAKNGAVSPAKFSSYVKKLTPEQRKIIFGFDAKSQKRLTDIIKVMDNLPPGFGSDTARNLAFMDMLNPIFQGKEILRYALYRGGDKAIRQYLLKTVPIVQEAEKQINKTKSTISSSVNGFYRSSGPTIAVAALALNEDRKIENAKKVYEQIYNDPQGFVDRFMVKNKDLMESAPNTGAALQSKMLSGLRFLQSKVPSTKTDFAAHEFTPSRSELLGFQEYVEAVEKPMQVFAKLKQGYISPRHIEALKVVYPKLYGALQEDLGAKMPKKISRYQKIMLQQILGVNVSPSANYQMMQQVLQTPSPTEQAPQQRVPASAVKNMNSASRAQSGLDKTLYRQ